MREIGSFDFPKEEIKSGGVVTAKVTIAIRSIASNPEDLKTAASNPFDVFLDLTIKDGENQRAKITELEGQFYNWLDVLESTYNILAYFLSDGEEGPSNYTWAQASLDHTANCDRQSVKPQTGESGVVGN